MKNPYDLRSQIRFWILEKKTAPLDSGHPIHITTL